jgi:predicted phosphodiesterase
MTQTAVLDRPLIAKISTSPSYPKDKLNFWIFSDLHVDVGHNDARFSFSFPQDRPDHTNKCDAVIIAGDLREDLIKSLKWIANSNFKKPVFYVAGNHDFWHGDLKKQNIEAKRFCEIHNFNQTSEETKIYYLDGDFVIFKDSHVICGGTLWTDYRLHGEVHKFPSMQAAQTGMNDHRYIKYGPDRKFATQDAILEFNRTLTGIISALVFAENAEITPVVITHHAPSEQSVNDKYFGDSMNPSYASNLENVAKKARLWVHGHMHDSVDYEIEDCRVICNPRGYSTNLDLNRHFDPVLVIGV